MKKYLLPYLFFFFSLTSLVAQESNIQTPQWRPVYHFTPLKNWTNDPNGLIYIDGIYHLYNQQNPFENKWGHMSWGHATGTDLVHWKHLPIAIPETIDKDTTWRFSGCAVLDKNNSSGFCTRKNCIVAIYTADQPNLKKESQYVAYSNDGGLTFTNYNHNPVIDLNMKDFRDPNVFWFEKTKQWVMVVSLPTEHKVRFDGSVNLKGWKLLSEFGPAGYTKANWECPFLIQLPVDKNLNSKKWVLVTSAAGRERGIFMQYFTGDFDGVTFKNDNSSDTELTVDYGDCFYAAIPWNNLPANQKTFIGWMVPPAQETYPWRGQMSIPRDLSLKKTKDGLRLFQVPSAAIENNLSKISGNRLFTVNNLEINDEVRPIMTGTVTRDNSYWIEADLIVQAGAIAGLKIAQQKDKDNKTICETEIGYNAEKHQLHVDRSRSGKGKINENRLVQIVDVTPINGKIKLRILFDKSSLEVFVNDGEKVITTYIYPDKDADLLSAFSKAGKASINNLKIWNLSKAKD